ncbi:MAG TPA: DUF2063 domain-containing protein [Chromatiales bacterium]|nr:DUF2063 domain-containing protein [Chromatiales bacterium]
MAEDLRSLQARFAAHLRDPHAAPPPPGVPADRAAVYRELVYNNVEDQLAGAFPVARATLGEETWHGLVRAFLARHRARTPLFPELPRELLAFVADGAGGTALPPWLGELLHYEWVEIEVANDPRELPAAGCDPAGDLLSGRPVLNPLLRRLRYRWPVHEIGPDHVPDAPPAEPVRLAVWRDRAERVRFMALAPAAERLLELLEREPGVTGGEALRRAAASLGLPDPVAAAAAGAATLAALREADVLLGTRLP